MQLFIILLALLIRHVLGDCFVIEEASKVEKKCVFPFVLTNDEVTVSYNSCVTIIDPQKRPWCSTKTIDGTHQKGHWGYCDTGRGDCPGTSLGKNINTIIASASRGKNCPCLPLSSCQWADELINTFTILPPNDSGRRKALAFLRSQVCDSDSKTLKCCSSLFDADSSNQDIKKLGIWKPSEAKGECGSRLITGNIVGGKVAKLGEFPFMALLGYETKGQIYYLCGGSIINAKYILTAAHCSTDERPIKEVLVGEHTLGQDPDCKGSFCLPLPQKLSVESVRAHERWNPQEFRKGYDLALVRVRETIQMFGNNDGVNAYVAPVCLSWNVGLPGRSAKVNDSLTVTGWGRVTNDQKETSKSYREYSAASRTLQKVDIPIVSAITCKKTYPTLTESIQICAGGNSGQDSCGGDSGGPLSFRVGPGDSWYQVGIVSYGPKLCGSGVPGVYTKVAAFIDWIDENLLP